ncbi:MAG: biotin transporter BioY [Candidatus Neomarinimicrobiota bacterium]
MTYNTYADVLRPVARRQALAYDFLLLVGGSILLIASAQLTIHLPFSPVPITGQTFAVLLVGALLGSVRGGMVVLLYLAEGLSGLPVFAGGGAGPGIILGPTGGYLVGFVPAVIIVGFLAERGWDRCVLTTLAAMTGGTAAIFLCGLAWLSVFQHPEGLLTIGLWPFIPGAILKIVAAALLLPLGWRLPGFSTG